MGPSSKGEGEGRGERRGREGKGRREGGMAKGKGREVPYFRLTLLATLVCPPSNSQLSF